MTTDPSVQEAYERGLREGTARARGLTFQEVETHFDLTRRQIEYLIEKGGLRPSGGGVMGRQRYFDATEQEVLSILTRLVTAGWSVEKARPIAREVVDLGLETVRLPGGVVLTFPDLEEEGDTPS